MTSRPLKTIHKKLNELLTKEGIFDHDELAVDTTDILSNLRNQHNCDPEAGYGYKTYGERFHGY